MSAAAPAGQLVLLTGATGFIGAHLARRLDAEGLRVRCLVRAGSDTAPLEALGVELARGDLSDPASLEAAAPGSTHVMHCAALVSDWATVREIREVNVRGTRNLLDAAVRAGVARFVHLSSTDVYGHPGSAGVDETFSAARFSNWYAQSKREAEEAVRAARGLEYVILRPATVYGPGSVDVVGEIAHAIRARHMLLVNRGRANAGLCYVENLADAAMLALGSEGAAGRAFNVTDGLSVSWREFTGDLAAGLGHPPPRLSLPYPLARALALALEQGYRALRRATRATLPPLLSRQAVEVLGRDQDFSYGRALNVLGWEPRVGYREGMAATLAWLGSQAGA